MKAGQAQNKTTRMRGLSRLTFVLICAYCFTALSMSLSQDAKANENGATQESSQFTDAAASPAAKPQSSAQDTQSGSEPKPEKKKRKKKKKDPKSKKQSESSAQEVTEGAKDGQKKAAATPKEQRFEIVTVSDDVAAIDYKRPEPGLKVGDKMYVIHPDQNGFVAILEIEQIEPRQKSLSAKILENDPEFADNIALSGLEVMTQKRFLVEYDSYQDGPLHPETPTTFKLFSQYANRNPTLLVSGGMAFSQYKETMFVVEETAAPAATSAMYRGEIYLPEVFGQFWLNWLGGGYEMYESDPAVLKVKDGSGNTVDEAQANGNGTSAWASLKPTFPYFVMAKLELRAELMRNRLTQVYSPEQYALSEKSVVRATIKDTAPRYFLGYQSRLASFGFFQVTGMLPLQPEVTVFEERANGSQSTFKAKLKEINVEGRFFFHLTFMEPPHQLSLDMHIGGAYNQKTYAVRRADIVETIVTPYDLQPFVFLGFSYVK